MMNVRVYLFVSLVVLMVVSLVRVAPLSAAEGEPSAEEIKKMQAAMPARPRVQPAQPRKVLVFGRSWGYKHSAIPYGAKAFEIMGQKTGAFEAVVTNDDAMFEPANLSQFDAVVFGHNDVGRFDVSMDHFSCRGMINCPYQLVHVTHDEVQG